MAKIGIHYTVQSCSRCGKRLLKVESGSLLLICNKCGITYRTNLREEWYQYQPKRLIFRWSVILSLVFMMAGCSGAGNVYGLLAGAVFGILIGLCISTVDFVRILLSKRRMRRAEYLRKLLDYQAISWSEYEQFSKNAK